MKKYLPGIVAILLAVTAVAFTPKKDMSVAGKEDTKFADPCSSANKKWFLINLECIEQLQLTDLLAQTNYTITTPVQVDNLCLGSECVCAILACSNSSSKPIITSGTSIYTALNDYYYYGTASAFIALKNQYWARKAQ